MPVHIGFDVALGVSWTFSYDSSLFCVSFPGLSSARISKGHAQRISKQAWIELFFFFSCFFWTFLCTCIHISTIMPLKLCLILYTKDKKFIQIHMKKAMQTYKTKMNKQLNFNFRMVVNLLRKRKKKNVCY